MWQLYQVLRGITVLPFLVMNSWIPATTIHLNHLLAEILTWCLNRMASSPRCLEKNVNLRGIIYGQLSSKVDSTNIKTIFGKLECNILHLMFNLGIYLAKHQPWVPLPQRYNSHYEAVDPWCDGHPVRPGIRQEISPRTTWWAAVWHLVGKSQPALQTVPEFLWWFR